MAMRTMFVIFFSAFFTIALIAGSYVVFNHYVNFNTVSPIGFIGGPTPTPTVKPLEKYEILNLAARPPQVSQIVFDEPVATTTAYTKYPFYYQTNGKKVTGLATIPSSVLSSKSSPTTLIPPASGKLPVIVQFRGYVDPTQYSPGVGTSRSAEVYATNGFVSLAPDFLGYGDSNKAADDPFENRFETYTTAMDLISSVPTIPFVDATRMGIWGHSNGGHIAITVSEILNKPYPMTLWAPVTKYFPYSILYYMDEADDKGKGLRKVLAKFEADYDVDKFTLTNYLDRLVGPIQFHQGTADDAVPLAWSNDFVDKVKKLDKDITYYTYPGADHNMLGSWNTVVERDVAFFKEKLK